MIKLYIETLPVLNRAFVRLEGKIEKPDFVNRGSYKVFRYKTQSIEAAVIQKLARVLSGLHASLLLLSGGFVQELGVIFRTMDEFNEDILFLCQAIRTGEVTELHWKYLQDFYQEEFDEPDNPFLSEQKRTIIPRRKIHAAIADIPDTTVNPSDGKELYRTLSQAYSGYIHGASVHVMDMYGGNPPRFHVSGMLNTPRMKESTINLWDYFYRGLLSTMMVALSFKETDLLKELYSFRDHFEERSGKTKWDKPENKIKNLKNKNAQQKNRGDRK